MKYVCLVVIFIGYLLATHVVFTLGCLQNCDNMSFQSLLNIIGLVILILGNICFYLKQKTRVTRKILNAFLINPLMLFLAPVFFSILPMDWILGVHQYMAENFGFAF